MNTESNVSRKELPNTIELTAFLAVITLFAALTQPAKANVNNQLQLPDFCNNMPTGFVAEGEGIDPEIPRSLKCTPAPEPYVLDENGASVSISPSIIKNKAALIALGKMLFWDAQVGSDGIACASCHFQAGADNRIKNQINPGMRNESGHTIGNKPIGNVFDYMSSYVTANNLDFLTLDPLLVSPGKGPNYTLKKSDFPLRKYTELENAVDAEVETEAELAAEAALEVPETPEAIAAEQAELAGGVEAPEIVIVEAITNVAEGVVMPEHSAGWTTPVPDPALLELEALEPVEAEVDLATVVVTDPPAQFKRSAEVVYDSDDVVSSQGVYPSKFNTLTAHGRQEVCDKQFPTSGLELPVFNVAGYTVRQAAPRNTPSVINAVYNHRNFWDGRANNVFNGVDPFGERSFATDKIPDTEIYAKPGSTGSPMKQRIAIYNASLASQAVGPALSDLEMSCSGKAFPELGKKMLTRKPLANQKVDSTDSVLGPYAKPVSGIKPEYTYKKLIQDAFNNSYWDDTQKIGNYTLTENNFSLFWGLAIQAYEATLVSDDSRFDRAYENPNKPEAQLTQQEEHGKTLFIKGECVACHSGSEFTAASVNHVLNAEDRPNSSKYIERMMMGDGGVALYDAGFYNIGVRPSVEDRGIGGTDPYGFPLSFAKNAKMNANDPKNFFAGNETPNISSLFPDSINTNSMLFDTGTGCISWNPLSVDPLTGFLCGDSPVVSDERVAVDGAFKAPSLRNVELTGPYFHNGGQATLEQVVQFYNRGGDRMDHFQKDAVCNGAVLTEDAYGNKVIAPNPTTGLIDDTGLLSEDGSGYASNLAADMAGHRSLEETACGTAKSSSQTLKFSNKDVEDLVAFLKTLTDERVRWEQAPFDHPSLTLPHGHVGDENWVKFSKATNQAQQLTYTLPAVGAAGRGVKALMPLKSFESGLQ
jgi:cytochrome c peroxidase